MSGLLGKAELIAVMLAAVRVTDGPVAVPALVVAKATDPKLPASPVTVCGVVKSKPKEIGVGSARAIVGVMPKITRETARIMRRRSIGLSFEYRLTHAGAWMDSARAHSGRG